MHEFILGDNMSGCSHMLGKVLTYHNPVVQLLASVGTRCFRHDSGFRPLSAHPKVKGAEESARLVHSDALVLHSNMSRQCKGVHEKQTEPGYAEF